MEKITLVEWPYIRASGISVCFNGFNYLQRPDKLEALIIFFGRRAVLARQNSESRRSLMRGGIEVCRPDIYVHHDNIIF